MTIMLTLLGVATALELLVHLTGKITKLRSVLASAALLLGAFASGGFVVLKPNVFSVLLVVIGIYRVLNMIRVVGQRMHARYLITATRRTSIVLLALQLVVLALWWAWSYWHTTGHAVWAAVGAVQLAVAIVLFVSTIRTLRRTMWPSKSANYADDELPTITVGIPARNETEDLQRCLQSVIASDYPKLEIIVLDDCSQTRRTPEIIREFAHAGVRFVQGKEPSDTWLPKNEAYARLFEEASGKYVLFCGVDIRFEPHSIRGMITTMLDRNKKMLAILPLRQREVYGHFSLIQAMRYWWELVPPRRAFRRPPVLSSCWMAEAAALKKAGGFASVARAVVPEAHFARELIQVDGYSFLRSGDSLGVSSNKRIDDQRITAMRMRYPQLHRRPENVAIITFAELFFLLAPPTLFVTGFWVSVGVTAQATAILASILLFVTYAMAAIATRVNTWWFALLASPFATITDIALLHYSMWKYEFSTVDWKGRNVCVPVMHVVPALPYRDQGRR